jgi:hypothetical protein
MSWSRLSIRLWVGSGDRQHDPVAQSGRRPNRGSGESLSQPPRLLQKQARLVRRTQQIRSGLLQRRRPSGHFVPKPVEQILEICNIHPRQTFRPYRTNRSSGGLELRVGNQITLAEQHDVAFRELIAHVGTPQTVAAQELRIECMFPADETTKSRHNALMRGLRHRGQRQRATPVIRCLELARADNGQREHLAAEC